MSNDDCFGCDDYDDDGVFANEKTTKCQVKESREENNVKKHRMSRS